MNHSLRFIIFAILFMMAGNAIKAEPGDPITVRTKNSELIFKTGKDHKLYQCYFGQSLNDADAADVLQTRRRDTRLLVPHT